MVKKHIAIRQLLLQCKMIQFAVNRFNLRDPTDLTPTHHPIHLSALYSSRVLLSNGRICPACIVFEDGYVSRITSGRLPGALAAENLLVLPGIIDIHGDAFERQLAPRPTAGFPISIALRETDRQLIANGVTTAFYGITVSWEPGLRSLQNASSLMAELERNRPALASDSRVHLRFETRTTEAIEPVCEWLRSGRVDLLSFNDHTELTDRKLSSLHGASGYADRSGLSIDEFDRLFRHIKTRTNDECISALAPIAATHGIPIAAHDVESATHYDQLRQSGCTICEFPKNMATAAQAREYGDHIVLGAPNVVRGGTHSRGLTATEAIRSGLCTVLSSDYYYPSLLLAAFQLANENILPLPEAWNLISKNAASAAGLADRGSIEIGNRADFVLVDDSDLELPHVVGVVREGVPVLLSGGLAARQANASTVVGADPTRNPWPAA
jgi:alpha-D-ribose 1-methylphosphonate 5-triphosphate diphosphatase